MGTLLVNIPKMTSYAFGRRLNRKCHILSANVTKHFKNYETKLDEAEATTAMRPRPVITRDEDLTSLMGLLFPKLQLIG